MSQAPRPIWQERFPQACDWDAAVETGTVPDLLVPAVAARPDAVAIAFRESELSYGELDRLATRSPCLTPSAINPAASRVASLSSSP